MGKVLSLDEMRMVRQQLKRDGKKLVFTNGCFDLIHRGHVEYLKKAKAFGDALLVGLNSDQSVRKIKGDGRPIINENDRSFILANLVPVDFVCLFQEETPLHLISTVVPDVLVKGADWKIDDIVGKDVVERAGGRVATVEYVENHSTSEIIEKIVQQHEKKS